ncbi:MAG: phytoene/squalene synthase family protein [Planctomycetes bacterium]|nr:phytoene/squalene synthase family protein [Planctomycetota bacterium]
MPCSLTVAYSECAAITRERARNFVYAFGCLPAEKRRAIEAAYAFSRICDDIADGSCGPSESEENPAARSSATASATATLPEAVRAVGSLAECRTRLAEALAGRPDGPVFTALADAAARYRIPASYFEELISGVEMDLTVRRYEDFDALRQYCCRVASVPGLIALEIFGYEGEAARDHAVDLGIAMQLTNILRDLKEDADRNRVYLPQSDLRQFGYSEPDLKAGVRNAAFTRLMEYQVRRARDHFTRGLRILAYLPRRSRACPYVLALLYRGLLSRIESSGYDVFSRRIALSGPRKAWLMARGYVTAWAM